MRLQHARARTRRRDDVVVALERRDRLPRQSARIGLIAGIERGLPATGLRRRYFDGAARRWSVSAVDVYKGVVSSSTAEWRGGEMIVSGRGTESDGRAYLSRAIFSKITSTSFTYRLDRSHDNGKKWTEGITRIEAKRVAAAAPR